MIHVILYSRDDCSLCEKAIEDLEALKGTIPFELVIIDVDSEPDLQKQYGYEVPVVKIEPYTLKAPFTRQDLQMTLGAANDRERHINLIDSQAEAKTSASGKKWTNSDTFTYWISRHYMAFFNILVLIYVGLPFLAPVMMKAGMTGPANLIYRAYSVVCHQLAYRSFFVFGEQPVYPRAAAEVDEILSFSQATGMGEGSSVDEIFAARRYVGDDQVGYKVALCERDVAIYLGIFFFGLLFSITGRRIGMLPWYIWLLAGLVPIGLDGVSQLISQPPFNLFPFRESPPFFRIGTGALFGFTTAWFGYPLVEETMRETRQIMETKKKRLSKSDLSSGSSQ